MAPPIFVSFNTRFVPTPLDLWSRLNVTAIRWTMLRCIGVSVEGKESSFEPLFSTNALTSSWKSLRRHVDTSFLSTLACEDALGFGCIDTVCAATCASRCWGKLPPFPLSRLLPWEEPLLPLPLPRASRWFSCPVTVPKTGSLLSSGDTLSSCGGFFPFVKKRFPLYLCPGCITSRASKKKKKQKEHAQ